MSPGRSIGMVREGTLGRTLALQMAGTPAWGVAGSAPGAGLVVSRPAFSPG